MAVDHPPKGFTTLQAALEGRKNVDVDLMGVVSGFLPAVRTKGTDYQCTFNLKDLSFATSYQELDVKFFRKSVEELPKIQGTGDVVLLRRVKIKDYRGDTLALSNVATEWIVFPAAGIPEKVQQHDLPPLKCFKSNPRARVTPSEQLHAITLCNSQTRSSFTAPSEVPAPTTIVRIAEQAEVPREKGLSLVKDIYARKYYDIVAQVMKVYYGDRGIPTVYITDYTTNELLYDYTFDQSDSEPIVRNGDEFGYAPVSKPKHDKAWPGPWGQQVVQVSLWHPNSAFARDNVKVGDFVFLRNMHVKINSSTRLEGGLHTDQKYPERLAISVIDNIGDLAKDSLFFEPVKKLLERKRAYRKKLSKKQLAVHEQSSAALKRKCDVDDDDQETGKKSKGKRRRNANVKQAAAAATVASESEVVEPVRGFGLNKHIRANHPAIRPLSVDDILNHPCRQNHISNDTTYRLPFNNVCYRPKVRVVDFYPPNIADFAVPCESSEFDLLSNNGSDDSDTDSAEGITALTQTSHDGIRWEWRFCLLVEDGSAKAGAPNNARMKVFVDNLDAEMLLKQSAAHLRENPPALASLREKLFIMWGDLEEVKSAASPDRALAEKDPNSGPRSPGALTSTPSLKSKTNALPLPASSAQSFECCIKEYGVRIRQGDESRRALDEETAWTGWEARWRLFGTTIM